MATRAPFIQTPFALSGDVAPIPNAAPVDGSVSFETGFGPDYQADQETDPNAKPVPRPETNWLYNTITALLRFWQTETFPEWISPSDNSGVAFAYEVGTVVRYRATGGDPFVNYVNTVPNNTNVPPGTGWRLFSEVVDALPRAGGTMTGPIVMAGSGNTVPTAAQFDNDLSVASTAFVQRALGNLQGTRAVNGSIALTAADAGKLIQCSGSGPYTVTLPAASSMPDGGTFCFFATTNGVTVTRAGSDVFQGTPVSSFVLNTGDTLMVEAPGPTIPAWNLLGGSASLGVAGVFAAVNTSQGYQKLPGGLIEVRGTFTASATPGAPVTVTFPFAMTTCHEIVITPESTGSSATSAWHDGRSGTGFNGHCASGNSLCNYIAKGI